MIDTRLLLDDYDATARRLARKGGDPALLDSARDLARQRRDQVRSVDAGRAEMNSRSAEVGGLLREGKREEADGLRARLADARAELDADEKALREIEEALNDVVLRIPN